MKRLFFTIILLLVGTPILFGQAHDSHVVAALKLVDLGNAREASDNLRDLIAQDSKNAEAHAGLAIALVNLNQIPQAETEAQAGFDLNRHDALVRVARGTVYGKEGRIQDALNEFHVALDIDNKDIGTMVALSHYYISIDSLKPAEITLYQAQQVNDKDVRSYLGLAELYERQHIPELAIDQYQKAMKIDPNDVRVHAALAGLYLRTYKYNESAEEWLKIIQIDSTYADAYRQIANLYLMAHQYGNSAKYAKKYVELKPNDIEGQWIYAQALAEGGQYTEALPYLQAVSANDSLRPLAQLMLARSYFYSKDYSKALDIYRNAKSLSPSDLSFFGDALIVTGDTAAGIEQLRKSLAGDTVGQDRMQTEKAIGNLLYAQKRYGESAQMFAQMASEWPTADNYLSAGQIYAYAKMQDSAMFYYNKALALDPNSLKVHMQLAIQAQAQNAASDTALHAFEGLKQAATSKGSSDTAAIADGFIGYHYIALKDYEEATAPLEASVKVLESKQSPYLGTFLTLLAGVYIQNHDIEKAKLAYERVLKINPNDEDAQKGLDYIKQVGESKRARH